MIEDSLSFLLNKENWLGGVGLSPHAPYTASPKLTRLAAETASRHKMLLTIHLAESHEEMEMFRRWPGSAVRTAGKSRSPDGRLRRGQNAAGGRCSNAECIDERWIVVHLNELAEEDFVRLESGPRFHIAHCPRSSRYFQHRPFAMQRVARPAASTSVLGQTASRAILRSAFSQKCKLCGMRIRGSRQSGFWRWPRSNSARALDQKDSARQNPRWLSGRSDRATDRECGAMTSSKRSSRGSETVPWMLRRGHSDAARIIEDYSHICLFFSHP